MESRVLEKARERLLALGVPKATSSTTLMETRAIKDDKELAHLLKN
jgi:hypothetical protein